MSVLYAYLGNTPITFGSYGSTSSVASTSTTWTRPSDWLAMPDTSSMTGSAGAFVGLFAVYTGSSNFVALSAAPSYSVNWGDGVNTASLYASGVQANYSYSFDSLPSSSYSSGSGATGGVGGYRQVLITVTPSGSGQLTNVNLQKKNNSTTQILSMTSNTNYGVDWLDIAVGGSNISSLSIGGASSPYLRSLQRGNIVNISSSLTNFSSMFQNCYSLSSVPLFNTQNGSNFSSMFNSCNSL